MQTICSIKINQHAAAIHLAPVDTTAGTIGYPFCGTGTDNLLGRRTVKFAPVIVTETPTCKRCTKAEANQLADIREWTAADTASVVAANVEAKRALRNFRDFGNLAMRWEAPETTASLQAALYIDNDGRITRIGLDQLA